MAKKNKIEQSESRIDGRVLIWILLGIISYPFLGFSCFVFFFLAIKKAAVVKKSLIFFSFIILVKVLFHLCIMMSIYPALEPWSQLILFSAFILSLEPELLFLFLGVKASVKWKSLKEIPIWLYVCFLPSIISLGYRMYLFFNIAVSLSTTNSV